MNHLILEECIDYNDLSQKCCDLMISCIIKDPSAVICLATGASPTGSYKRFVDYVKNTRLDVSKVTFVKLDEWLGIPLTHPCTCEQYLQKNIYIPLNIKKENIISFDTTADPSQECARISALLNDKGGLDLCILGLGKNGHLGLNEPAETLIPFSHTLILDDKTKSHEMLKDVAHLVSEGITLGLRDIFTAREIAFLVSGEDKTGAFNAFCKQEISTGLPCSLLWLHQNVKCFYDARVFQP
ncbi:galactosamine-6-phosphate isomerase [Yersinia intermedia]|nr:galactosamine-6-phosphate isomerase [Yersinia intermedia]